MKTKLFLFMMAVAAIMITFSSCEKEPIEPTIIDSEVLDKGIAALVDEKTETDAAGVLSRNFSYESWIMLRMETRAVWEQRVSVVLNNNLKDVKKEISVVSWNFGSMNSALSYKENAHKKEGRVTIVDSVLVYTVSYSNFSFDFELPYQVPIYSDGVSTQIMPHYLYENIVDNGGKITKLDNIMDNKGFIHSRRLYEHTLSLSFNSKVYTIKADVILDNILNYNGKECVVDSEVIEEGLSEKPEGTYLSWIKVKQKWSTGEEKVETYSIELYSSIASGEEGHRKLTNTKIERQSSILVHRETPVYVQANGFIWLYNGGMNYVITYNYFTISYDVVMQRARYDDGVTFYEMPYYDLTDKIGEEPYVLERIRETESDGVPAVEYDFYQTIYKYFGTNKHSATTRLSLFVPQ